MAVRSAVLSVFLASLGAIALAFLSPGPSSAGGDTIYAISGGNTLVSFNSATPGAMDTSTAVSGLMGGETLVTLDFRPATGQLYSLSSANRLYQLNKTTAVATAVIPGPVHPFTGQVFGFDFQPVTDFIRVVSNLDENVRVNPTTGVPVIDGALAYDSGDPNFGEDPAIDALAYSNNFPGASSTLPFALDFGEDTLVQLGGPTGAPSPNTGVLFTVGPLGVDFASGAGLDIKGANTAYASLVEGTTPTLFAINLTTGAATSLGTIGVATVTDIAVEADPAPTPTPVTITPVTVTPAPTISQTPPPTAVTVTPPPTTPAPTPTAPTVTPTPAPTVTPVIIRKGDIDCDGDIDGIDALLLLLFAADLPAEVDDPCLAIGEPVD